MTRAIGPADRLQTNSNPPAEKVRSKAQPVKLVRLQSCPPRDPCQHPWTWTDVIHFHSTVLFLREHLLK